MANIVKQVAIYKDNNWSTKDIGVDVDKVFLKNKTLGVETGLSLDQILNKFPEGNFAQGFIAADGTGKLTSTQISPAKISELETSINNLNTNLSTKNNTWVRNLLADYLQNDFYFNESTIREAVRQELMDAGYTPSSTDTGAMEFFFEVFGNALYPVGSIFITTSLENSPEKTLGGTWVRIKDKFLLDADQITGGGNKTLTPSVKTMTLTQGVVISNHVFTPTGNNKHDMIPAAAEKVNQGTSVTANLTDKLVITKTAKLPADLININFEGDEIVLSHTVEKQPAYSITMNSMDIIPPYEKVYIWRRETLAAAHDTIMVNPEKWNQDFLLSRETIDKWNEIKNYSPTEGEV